MTQDPHSADLDRIKSLLAKSFDSDEGPDVPPLPDSLRDRITDQYGRRTSAAPAPSESLFAMFARWFAQPAFAGATVAIVLTLAAVMLLKQPGDQPVFRGGTESVAVTTIVLYQVDEATTATLRESGYFDEKALRVINTAEELAAIAPPRIILDGSTGTIRSHEKEGVEPTITELPEDPAALPDVLAELLRAL